MRWSWKIASPWGIGLYVHWTFLILLAFVFIINLRSEAGWQQGLAAVAFILAVFACVVLHEFGHALTARRFGIATRDVTLLPIGGIARLERIPEEPKQELLIAIAGPAVNVVIALLLYAALAAIGVPRFPAEINLTGGNFLASLMMVNVILVAFNLLPAFPMDGGRVLRALLATRLPWSRATQIAANVGQFMAILFGAAGLFTGNFLLLFIALFVYLGAAGEAQMAELRSALRGAKVRDAMITQFRSLRPSDSLSDAVDELLTSPQQDFPVTAQGQPLGMLLRRDLIHALSARGRASPVSEALQQQPCESVTEDLPLEETYARMRESDCPAMPVLRNGILVGLLTLENISEYLMVRSALEQAAVQPPRLAPGIIRQQQQA